MAKSIRQGKMTAYRNLRGGGTEYLEMNSLDGDRPVSGWMNCPKCKHKDAHYLAFIDKATGQERKAHWVGCEDCNYEGWTREAMQAFKEGKDGNVYNK